MKVDVRGETRTGAFASVLRVSGGATSIAGTSTYAGPRIVAIDGYEIDAIPNGPMLLTRHHDVPGMIGRVGTILGEAERERFDDASLARRRRGRCHHDPLDGSSCGARNDRPDPRHRGPQERARDRRLAMIWLARHCETTWNMAGRYQGRLESALSALGVRQGLALADAFSGRLQRGEAVPARIVTSPLLRCAATARFTADRLGIPLETDDRLLEIAHGTWEGPLSRRSRARGRRTLSRVARRSRDGDVRRRRIAGRRARTLAVLRARHRRRDARHARRDARCGRARRAGRTPRPHAREFLGRRRRERRLRRAGIDARRSAARRRMRHRAPRERASGRRGTSGCNSRRWTKNACAVTSAASSRSTSTTAARVLGTLICEGGFALSLRRRTRRAETLRDGRPTGVFVPPPFRTSTSSRSRDRVRTPG